MTRKIKDTQKFNTIGVIGPDPYASSDSKAIRFTVEDVNGTNEVIIEAKIFGASNWDSLGTITGAGSDAFDIYTYDEFRIRCSTFDASGFGTVFISTTEKTGSGLVKITGTAGESVLNNEVNFISSDGTVVITGNDTNKSVNFQASAASASEYKTEQITLTIVEVTNKQVSLASTPVYANRTILSISGGPDQVYGVDYSVSGSTLTWNGLGLDGELGIGDVLILMYI